MSWILVVQSAGSFWMQVIDSGLILVNPSSRSWSIPRDGSWWIHVEDPGGITCCILVDPDESMCWLLVDPHFGS